jgi:hypothetical protein
LADERILALFEDVLLPVDRKNRYDIYLTDGRIALVCLGKIGRHESESAGSFGGLPSAFGMPAPIQKSTQPKVDMAAIKEEINRMPLDDLLRLSKRSCYYTYDEVEEFRLILSRHPVFKILSEDCESKFAPNARQARELLGWLTSIETLRNKLSIAGNWKTLQEIFQNCPP